MVKIRTRGKLKVQNRLRCRIVKRSRVKAQILNVFQVSDRDFFSILF